MIPGMNSRQAKQMMKKMGIAQQELDAEQVIIRCKGENIIIDNPQVSKVNMMGQETFQVVGAPRVEKVSQEIEISEDDIKTVMEQTNVNEETAKVAIADSDGDLAGAILSLSED
jgi:nascent polypeptide-associated complex subunit alpha